MNNFKVWFEQLKEKKIIFLDMDETLVHHMGFDWLKSEKIDKTPYNLNPKIIQYDGKKEFIYPRPDVNEFLDELVKFADLYILSHNTLDYLHHVVKKLKWDKYFQDIFTTRKLAYGALNKKLNLDNTSWVLIDNLPVDSLEVSNKMKILGIDGKDFLKKTKNHFIKVNDWIPSIIKKNDNALMDTMKEIKQKLI